MAANRNLQFAIEAIPTQGMLGTVLGVLADLVVSLILGAVVLGLIKLIGKLATTPAAKPAQ